VTVRHNNSVGNGCKVSYFGIRRISSSTDFKLPIHQSKVEGEPVFFLVATHQGRGLTTRQL